MRGKIRQTKHIQIYIFLKMDSLYVYSHGQKLMYKALVPVI